MVACYIMTYTIVELWVILQVRDRLPGDSLSLSPSPSLSETDCLERKRERGGKRERGTEHTQRGGKCVRLGKEKEGGEGGR